MEQHAGHGHLFGIATQWVPVGLAGPSSQTQSSGRPRHDRGLAMPRTSSSCVPSQRACNLVDWFTSDPQPVTDVFQSVYEYGVRIFDHGPMRQASGSNRWRLTEEPCCWTVDSFWRRDSKAPCWLCWQDVDYWFTPVKALGDRGYAIAKGANLQILAVGCTVALALAARLGSGSGPGEGPTHVVLP